MIFLPNTIRVGYQKRGDTYSGKLAYIIYIDEKGKVRKEASWQSWRDDKIEPEDFDNIPTSGFVLNRRAGGREESYSSWNTRKTYCRVYDPRGFEFEIDISNLLYILENTNSIVGKGLEGEFVYGWGGTELILIPTSSPDYSELVAKSEIIKNRDYLKAKELEEGKIYENMSGKKFVYAGKRSTFEMNYRTKYTIENPKTHVFFDLENDGDLNYDYLQSDGERNYRFKYAFEFCKTIPKLIDAEEGFHPNYAKGVALMDGNELFNPDKHDSIYQLVKSTPTHLELYDTLIFHPGRNHHYRTTQNIGVEFIDGVKNYFFREEKDSYGYWNRFKSDRFPAEEFIKEYWLKTYVKIK